MTSNKKLSEKLFLRMGMSAAAFMPLSAVSHVLLSDRVIVMSPRPGRVKAEITIPLSVGLQPADQIVGNGYSPFSNRVDDRAPLFPLVHREHPAHGHIEVSK